MPSAILGCFVITIPHNDGAHQCQMRELVEMRRLRSSMAVRTSSVSALAARRSRMNMRTSAISS